MKLVVAIDPGGAHVGWCEGLIYEDGTVYVDHLQEYDPDGALDRAEAVFPNADVVVIESFRLYPDKAKTLVGSEMETSQLIGALKYLARRNAREPIMQPASIKAPTESLMRHRGVRHVAVTRGLGGHVKDAETHLYQYVYRNR